MEFLNGKDPHFNTDLPSNLNTPKYDPLSPDYQRQESALFALDEQLLRTTLSGNNWQTPSSPQPLLDWRNICWLPADPLSSGVQLDNEWGKGLGGYSYLYPLTFTPSPSKDDLFSNNFNLDIAAKYVRALADLPAAVTDASTQALDDIRDFLHRDDYLTQLQLAYGNDLSATTIESAIAKVQALPQISILPADTLGTADGAFDGTNNKIYLSQNLVARGNADEISAVIIEEIGHYLDRQFHGNLDTPIRDKLRKPEESQEKEKKM